MAYQTSSPTLINSQFSAYTTSASQKPIVAEADATASGGCGGAVHADDVVSRGNVVTKTDRALAVEAKANIAIVMFQDYIFTCIRDLI